ncbi:MAG: hypothetical protein GXY15_05015 [Candidatus Hydrogenedentes bacterium]|nr:hypothetical protein [Candidatus Hydrogenedentota bacterium]
MTDNVRPTKRHTAKARPDCAAAAGRRADALALRIKGLTFAGIGDTLGVDTSTAYRYVRDALAETLAECAELAEHLRELENQRLDEMQAALWEKALAGVFPAADRVLRIMERRAKLNGLDAPQKIAPTDPSGENPYTKMTDDELRALAAQILEADHD